MSRACATLLLASAFGVAGCGSEPEPRGRIEVDVAGLAAGDVVTLVVRHPSNILGDDGFAIGFDDVGNGVHVREDVPMGRFVLQCASPRDGRGTYQVLPPTEPSASLDHDGQTIRLECRYREAGYVRLSFEGLDATIPQDFCIGNVTRRPDGAKKTWCVGQSGTKVPLEPGSYDVSCEPVVGNAGTTKHELTSISVTSIELASGETQEIVCAYAPQP